MDFRHDVFNVPSSWLTVDLYPAIYKGEDVKGTDNYREPQLTYAQDHPGEEQLPAFHFAVTVTGTGTAQAARP